MSHVDVTAPGESDRGPGTAIPIEDRDRTIPERLRLCGVIVKGLSVSLMWRKNDYMKNAGEETLTFALLLYYSFHFWFDAIKTEQQPIESCQTPPPQLSSLHSQKLCSLSPSLAPSAQRRLLRYSTPPAQSLLVALHLALLTLYYCLSHLRSWLVCNITGHDPVSASSCASGANGKPSFLVCESFGSLTDSIPWDSPSFELCILSKTMSISEAAGESSLMLIINPRIN
ncbi:hypothetical protein Bca52824_066280 [Brassica carinata]|uniref:Uncharacterized protein n=1 Tax=Brassica carinata TaxID=52824 RepID=A0A8X7U9Y3_BRACI|nr:hypothetical protein Bca52824_066280 [Brassica carinata]